MVCIRLLARALPGSFSSRFSPSARLRPSNSRCQASLFSSDGLGFGPLNKGAITLAASLNAPRSNSAWFSPVRASGSSVACPMYLRITASRSAQRPASA